VQTILRLRRTDDFANRVFRVGSVFAAKSAVLPV